MPLPLALPFALACGITLAWFARTELARAEVPLLLTRPFLVALGMGFLVVAPVLGYFAALHEDWAWLYLVRASRIPSAVDLVVVLAVGAAVPLGLVLAAPWAIAKRGALVARVTAVCVVLFLIGCAVFARRLAVSATFAQFHGGFGALPASKTILGRGLLSSWITLAAGYAWSAWVLRPRRAADRG